MSVLQGLTDRLSAHIERLAISIGIIRQVVEGDETATVADGVGGNLPSFRKIAADVNAHIPVVLAAVDEAETIIDDGTAAVDLLVAAAETIIADGQTAADASAQQAAASEANVLSFAYAAVAAVSGDALHANVFVSPKTLTENVTVLAGENAIGLFSVVPVGVNVVAHGQLKII